MEMPFGKHRGKQLSEIPDSYLMWILDNVESLSPTLRYAIELRLGLVPPPDSPPPPSSPAARGGATVEMIIRAWHRQMAKRYHPDRGGTHEQMLVVNEGAELLNRLAGL